MHAPDTRSLTLVLEREEAARDDAALAVQRAQQHLDRAQAQMEQLTTYRSEYIARWSDHFSRQSSMEIVHCYRSFMQRLDHAMAQQQTLVQRQQATVEHARTALLAAELKVAAVKKLIDRRVDEHRRRESRREQKQTDETAQHAAWRASQNDSAFS